MPVDEASERPLWSLHLIDLMAFMAGLAVAYRVFSGLIRRYAWYGRAEWPSGGGIPSWWNDIVLDNYFLVVTALALGGLSVAGLPLLLAERFHRTPRDAWGPGKTLWLVSGAANGLLWLPILFGKIGGDDRQAAFEKWRGLYFGLLPLIMFGLVLVHWFSSKCKPLWSGCGSWYERFGLVLGLTWASIGLLLIVICVLMCFTAVEV